jgi:hypothetical protein
MVGHFLQQQKSKIMKIKIIGTLPDHVTDMGVKPGQTYDAEPTPNTRLDAVRFKVLKESGSFEWCTLMPKNYRKI